MNYEIISIHWHPSQREGSDFFYYVFFKANGVNYKTCIDPTCRNWKRWKDILTIGSVITDLRIRKHSKTPYLIDADSDFRIVKDNKPLLVELQDVLATKQSWTIFKEGNFFIKEKIKFINPNKFCLIFSNWQTLMNVYNRQFMEYGGIIMTAKTFEELAEDSNYTKIALALINEFGAFPIDEPKFYAQKLLNLGLQW